LGGCCSGLCSAGCHSRYLLMHRFYRLSCSLLICTDLLYYLPGLPVMSVKLITSGALLTSHEPLGFSRLCIPILFESYNADQDTDYEDCQSAQSSKRWTYKYMKPITRMLPRIWIRNIQRHLRIRTHRKY